MTVSWQIPRNCLAWTLVSQVVLIIPHAQRLPWWTLVVYLLCALWRIFVYQGRWPLPAKSLKVLFTLLCFLGIYQSYGTVIGLEPTVALLFSGLSLKLLEINSRRDVFIIIYLAYFAALTAFLFSQDFFIAVTILVTLLLITTALVALHQHSAEKTDFDKLSLISFRKSSLLFLQAVPLMVLLFIIFPRFEPFWTVQSASQQAKTGISDTMAPGDIANLSQNDGLAFRAVFSGEVPTNQQLYWRGLVLSGFDGRKWHQGRWKQDVFSEQSSLAIASTMNDTVDYIIIQEPSFQHWLFSIPLAYSGQSGVKIMKDFRLVRLEPVRTRIKYSVSSDVNAVIQAELSPQQKRFETKLPEGFNPKSIRYAQQLFAESASKEIFIQQVLNTFRDNPFFYTVKPPLLGKHTVDEFLFSSRKGFCSHYASSFVFLMRAAGIPARVVIGYQGGEVNPITGSVLVHQFDAHAWAEVWFADKGWIRFDPTASVSPARIEYGLEQALAQEEEEFLSESPFSPLRFRNIEWMNMLRMRADAFSYYWSNWVLGYEGEIQQNLLKKLLGEVTQWRIALGFVVSAAIILLLVYIMQLRGQLTSRQLPEIKQYIRFCQRLEKAGYARQISEGPVDFCSRVGKLRPEWEPLLQSATRTFVKLAYAPLTSEQHSRLVKQLKKDTKKLTSKL